MVGGVVVAINEEFELGTFLHVGCGSVGLKVMVINSRNNFLVMLLLSMVGW